MISRGIYAINATWIIEPGYNMHPQHLSLPTKCYYDLSYATDKILFFFLFTALWAFHEVHMYTDTL